MEYIHSVGVIHRDISPDNLILRNGDELPVLIDFGCIKEVESEITGRSTFGGNLQQRDSSSGLRFRESRAQTTPTKTQSELSNGNLNKTIPLFATAIGKAGYAPPEQVERGIVYAHSDLYALAATAVVLLAGKEPQQLIDLNNYRWRSLEQSAVTVSPKLEWILMTMLAPNPSDRFGSAAEVSKTLQDISVVTTAQFTQTEPEQNLQNFQPKTSKTKVSLRKRLGKITGRSIAQNIVQWRELGLRSQNYKFAFTPKFLYLIPLTAILILGGYLYSKTADLETAKTDSVRANARLQARISQGEKLLIEPTTSEKEMAIDAMARGKYDLAVALFKTSLQTVSNDPEALIYLNNARIGQAKAYTIAVTVPVGSNLNAAQEILRGVAQAQNSINRAGGINNVPLKVQIVNDDDDRAIAKTIANNLTQDREILGVVGHYASDVTLATAPIYEAKKLVAISPISTSVKLSNYSPYIFRTVPSDFLAARGLAEYMLENLDSEKVAVFANSQSNYSKSLESEFTAAVALGGGEVVSNFDLADPNFNAGDCLEEAIAKGAKTIMLAANTDTLDEALQVVQVNRQRLSLLGGDAIYNRETLQVAGEEGENMVLAIPWHIQNNPDSEFARTAEQLWGGEVGWRSAMAYDAVQALITAITIDTNPTRTSIQKNLADPDFSASGASDRIDFLASSDRSGKIQLVKIQPGNSELGYKFVPID